MVEGHAPAAGTPASAAAEDHAAAAQADAQDAATFASLVAQRWPAWAPLALSCGLGLGGAMLAWGIAAAGASGDARSLLPFAVGVPFLATVASPRALAALLTFTAVALALLAAAPAADPTALRLGVLACIMAVSLRLAPAAWRHLRESLAEAGKGGARPQ